MTKGVGAGRVRSGLLWLLLAIAFAGCAQLPPRPDLPEQRARAVATDAALDRMIAPEEGRHPDQSAFRLVSDGTEAFTQRMLAVRSAARSLDIQTYIWHADLTGMFFAQEILRAADRGVRVRLLLDDVDARRKNDAIAALSAHSRIEVRIFNPFATRHGFLTFLGEGLMRFDRINRRMHNKTWIADNRYAVVGGRNVGDEYFGAGSELNFVDLDFAMIGPVVRQASDVFDRYWNSSSAYPIETLDPAAVNRDALDRLRATLDERIAAAPPGLYQEALSIHANRASLIDGEWTLEWSARWRFVADDPAKVRLSRSAARARSRPAEDVIAPMLKDARERLDIISPYFVPGDAQAQSLVALARGGKSVRILTNSLIANDVAAVHGGYARYRKPLLRGGVQLWELKPQQAGGPESSIVGSSGASLHTKAFAVDGRSLFVGSYNLDPRSTWLNSEQGVWVESTRLTREMDELFERHIEGPHAWRVELDGGRLAWNDGEHVLHSEPEATLMRRLSAWLARFLRLDAQL